MPRTCRCASSDMQTPPGSAIPSSRAAMLTPSPKISLSSMMMSPTWMPMRNSIRISAARPHSALPCRAGLQRRSDRIDDARELDQHAVAGRLDDAAAMRGDGGIDEVLPDRLEPGQRAFLVDAHETAVAGDIRRQHRCQSPFHPLARQRMPPKHGRSHRIKAYPAAAGLGPTSALVKNGSVPARAACPLSSQEQTSSGYTLTSSSCRSRYFAPQYTHFIRSSGRRWHRGPYPRPIAEVLSGSVINITSRVINHG